VPFALVGLSFVVSYSIYRAGGVIAADSYLAAMALAVVAAIAAIAGGRAKSAPRLPRAVLWPLVLLPLYLALQLVPLPLRLLEWVSPARAEIHRALAMVVPVGSFAPITVIPATTLLQLVQLVSCIIVFVTVRQIVWQLGERHWIAALPLVIIGVLEAAVGLGQSYNINPTPGRLPAGTYINHNHFAGLLEMILPFAVLYPVLLLSPPARRGKSSFWTLSGACFFMGAAALMLAAILRCFSRMGLVAALIGLCVCGAGTALCSGRMRKMSRLRRWALIGAGGLLCMLLGLIFLPPDQFVARFATSDIRAEIWKESLPLVRAYWFLGCGSGGFESVFMRYKLTDPMFRVDYAHNDYLQRLVELGIVGTLFAGSAMAAVLLYARRAALTHAALSGRALAIACLAAVAAILLHSFVDFNLYIPANAMVLAWICGIAVSVSFSSRSRRPSAVSLSGVRIIDVQPL
jgi:O-antigen ligase